MTTYISCRGWKLFHFLFACLFVTHALYPAFLSEWMPPLPRLFEGGIASFLLCQTCIPPAILFLAASQEPGLDLLQEVNSEARPLRVAHLIEASNPDTLIESGSLSNYATRAEELKYGQFRVRHDWQRAVRQFSEITPVIVVDARVLTHAVLEELNHIMFAKRYDQTFVVVRSLDLRNSSLQEIKDAPFRFVSIAALQRALPNLGWSLLFSSEGNLAKHLKKRIDRRLSRTVEEAIREQAHEKVLRELGAIEEVIRYEMFEYRWRRDEDTWPPLELPNDD